jgi:plasmid maintenance system antidote protein VapI
MAAKTIPWSEIFEELPLAVKAKAQKRYERLRREMLLRELRQAMKLSQQHVARASGIPQPNLSRLERQRDMQIATLAKVVKALGGKLEMLARFPGADVRILLPAA